MTTTMTTTITTTSITTITKSNIPVQCEDKHLQVDWTVQTVPKYQLFLLESLLSNNNEQFQQTAY